MSQLRKWTRRLAAAGVVTPLLAGNVEAQNSSSADTVPMFAFAIDPAAVAAGLRPLRTTSLPPAEREVRVWTGFGIGIPHTLYQLRTLGGTVHGAIILWWDHDGEWRPADNPESMHAYVARVFGCGRIRRHELVDACKTALDRHRPDWRRVLAQMDSLGVGTLQTPSGNPIVMDGFHMVVETRDGSGYRTAYFSMPSVAGPGDTPRVTAILEVLQHIREAGVRASTSNPR
jgi:hypothetical protein